MTESLKDGIIIIEGFMVTPNTKMIGFITYFPSEKIKIIKNEAVRFKQAVLLDSKYFIVSLRFKEEISSVNLVVSDFTLDDWDYVAKADQHGEWLCKQIGYPQGLLDENSFSWGKIIQWKDFRSHQSQINILYNNRV